MRKNLEFGRKVRLYYAIEAKYSFGAFEYDDVSFVGLVNFDVDAQAGTERNAAPCIS